MALITESKLLTDVALQNRVTMAIIHCAYGVVAEPPDVPNHANRLALAKNAMMDPTGFTRSFYPYTVVQPGIVENGADSSLIPDDTITYAVLGLWDTIANITVPQPTPGMMAIPILSPPPIPMPPPLV